jgi:branched-subunit amino acid ABC-type transport system permease component
MDWYLNQLPQKLVNGLTLGGVYALIAIGYTMVYGILFMLNFTHGEICIRGGEQQMPAMALSIADRGYVLQTGSIVLTDTAQNLLHNATMQKAYLGGSAD